MFITQFYFTYYYSVLICYIGSLDWYEVDNFQWSAGEFSCGLFEGAIPAFDTRHNGKPWISSAQDSNRNLPNTRWTLLPETICPV